MLSSQCACGESTPFPNSRGHCAIRILPATNFFFFFSSFYIPAPHRTLQKSLLLFLFTILRPAPVLRLNENKFHRSKNTVIFSQSYSASGASLVAQRVKNLPKVQGTQVPSLGQEDPLEKEMATHSSIFAWKIHWTEEPGGLQSMGSQRVRHD